MARGACRAAESSGLLNCSQWLATALGLRGFSGPHWVGVWRGRPASVHARREHARGFSVQCRSPRVAIQRSVDQASVGGGAPARSGYLHVIPDGAASDAVATKVGADRVWRGAGIAATGLLVTSGLGLFTFRRLKRPLHRLVQGLRDYSRRGTRAAR